MNLALHTPALALALSLPLLCATIQAQSTPPTPPPATLTIRMLNAKSGKPMRHYSLRVEFQGAPDILTLTTDKQGLAQLQLPATATAISLIAIPRKDHPDQPAYTVCGPFGQFLPIPTLLAHGFVPENACSDKLHLTPHPAEVDYLIEPLPWYNPAIE